MKIQQRLVCKNIGERSVESDWKLAFGGKSYGNNHLFRVNKIASFICKHEHADMFITLSSAWVHDVSLAYGNDDDPKKIAELTKNFLMQFPLSDEERGKIVHCVSHHEDAYPDLSIEAKIVHDADVIDKSGMLGYIRHIWKMTNMIKNRILVNREDFYELKEHLLQRELNVFTKTGKILTHKLNQERNIFFEDEIFALNLMGKISQLAMQGIISDHIALAILKQYPKKISLKILQQQLRCSFLKKSYLSLAAAKKK